MARRKRPRPSVPTKVESIRHDDKRANIPTADAHDFVDPATEMPSQLRYPRDPSLDPQLVWRGKDEQDSTDLAVDAPPVYIQEKIDPRVLIENLRHTAKRPEDEPELSLFDTFDGLDELAQIEFYQHQANWSNRMILGDSLQVMGSLAERELLRGKVQMVYVDPPYGIKFGSNWQVSARKRDVKDGKLEDAAREAEQIKAFRDTWALGIHSYLAYLRDRLVVARDLLTQTGSCFVQIGDANLHLVRNLLDEVFGSDSFVSQISFRTTTGATGELLPGTVDYVLWYSKERELVKYRQLYKGKAAGGSGAGAYRYVELEGVRRTLTPEERRDPSMLQAEDRIYRLDNLTSQSAGRTKGEGAASWFPVEFEGRTFRPNAQSRWKTNEMGMSRLLAAKRLGVAGNTLSYVRYIEDFPAFPINNFWDDTSVAGFGDPKLYVVQTNTKVIERCVLMCTDPGDLVLDPTCGSGTTAFVAEQWGRRWITIDTSRVALALARQRLAGAKFPYYLLADSDAGRAKESELTGEHRLRGKVGNDVRHGFVYARVQHITLKSIANNPDVKEGMSRTEIDAAIKRHAGYEQLYDKPYEDRSKVRVAGPFTVESLSPHRSLAFAGTVENVNRETISEAAATTDANAPTFEQSILDNLAKAGIQNGRRKERMTFAAVDPYAGEYIQALASQADSDTMVGISIGPQYGTVSPSFIKAAAKEAIHASRVGLLCVLAFSFDPLAVGVTESDGLTVDASDEGFANVAAERKLGRIPVLLVRMNADLLMGEDLQKTGAGNLFTVFGEPDIHITRTDSGEVIVDLRGVDVYDPTTGEIRSNDTGQIALWMIDTNYNGESFFVRHCYFTGGNDPYKRLKLALKSDIDAEAWTSLYQTTSRPFPEPETGRVAVKVINDYGDEVMKVFEI
ncbi:site-specific DNA-methyltransferase [Mycobacterium marseillense]|uniref:Site-specific DNA-methyltransferase n=1 Tax=Mycobacterium marseillense TaxID=701042 RepID=A0ABN5ZNJ2_9MYCO|nr:site-specific DNA-methyltransferase [Mycobacterium marseillense]MCV7407956.1 site-specific DNA-methyltransferase [Mycobacterium marseillense]ORA93860.1 site-specific DNA-methyltransferase [Mycobacterium marseillense]BBY09613.1 site-specific DNA-methyltransferase [Mycobacterium marseillense]